MFNSIQEAKFQSKDQKLKGVLGAVALFTVLSLVVRYCKPCPSGFRRCSRVKALSLYGSPGRESDLECKTQSC